MVNTLDDSISSIRRSLYFLFLWKRERGETHFRENKRIEKISNHIVFLE